MNRGETWQSFETALPPSLTANTLSFHARKPDWILYAGQKCETVGGWQAKVCHEEASVVLAPRGARARVATRARCAPNSR